MTAEAEAGGMKVLVIVRSRDDVPLLDPSMVTNLAPLRTISAVALCPVREAVTPEAGLILMVLVALAPGTELMTIGKASPVFSGDVVLLESSRFSTTGP